VRKTKEKEMIVEVCNESIEYIILVEHFIDSKDSSSKLENKSEDKVEDVVGSISQRLLFI